MEKLLIDAELKTLRNRYECWINEYPHAYLVNPDESSIADHMWDRIKTLHCIRELERYEEARKQECDKANRQSTKDITKEAEGRCNRRKDKEI